MEVFLERLLLELLVIGVQFAAFRIYEWLRAHARATTGPAEAAVA